MSQNLRNFLQPFHLHIITRCSALWRTRFWQQLPLIAMTTGNSCPGFWILTLGSGPNYSHHEVANLALAFFCFSVAKPRQPRQEMFQPHRAAAILTPADRTIPTNRDTTGAPSGGSASVFGTAFNCTCFIPVFFFLNYFRRRAQQLKVAKQREKEWLKAQRSKERMAQQQHMSTYKRHITFEDSVVLLEAAARNDIAEVSALAGGQMGWFFLTDAAFLTP